MIFRQLFEPLSSTYTYLIGCPDTGQALAWRHGATKVATALQTWQAGTHAHTRIARTARTRRNHDVRPV